MSRWYVMLTVAFTVFLMACSSEGAVAVENTIAPAAGDTSAPVAQQVNPTATPVPATTSTPEAAPAVELPDWQSVELTDARTGATFTLGGFTGQTVFVEPMATWCTNCRAQLGNVRSAREQLASEDYVFIALSVETNISSADLATYTQRQGFAWTFAVMTPELLRMLVEEFGRAVSNPPSTPHFIIRADNSYTDVVTGIESTAQIVEQLQAETLEVSAVDTLAVVEAVILPTAVPTATVVVTEEPTPAVVTIDRPEWHFIQFRDVRTGENFTLADFEGQTVFVEPMATWCGNCRGQLRNVRRARESLDPEQHIFIALSLETNLTSNDLYEYTVDEGFDWHFAVLTEEGLRQFVEVFGRSFAAAPSTPHFILRPDGTHSELFTGAKTTTQIVDQMVAASS